MLKGGYYGSRIVTINPGWYRNELKVYDAYVSRKKSCNPVITYILDGVSYELRAGRWTDENHMMVSKSLSSHLFKLIKDGCAIES